MSAFVRELFVREIKGGEGSGNFGHEGRPGEVGGSGEGGGETLDGNDHAAPKTYKDTKGADHKVNAELIAQYKVKVTSPTGMEQDANEAVAHVLSDSSLAKQMNKDVEFKPMEGRYGSSKGKLFIDSETLKKDGPGFAAVIIRHELEHSILTSRGVPSSEQERKVRYTSGLWAAQKYSSMAVTNPRAADGFKKAAMESGIRFGKSLRYSHREMADSLMVEEM